MEPTSHFTQPLIVTAADGTQFRCAVEWVEQPLRSGAAQCLAEHWVFRTSNTVYVGPPVGEISSAVDLQQTIDMWRDRGK